MTGDPQAVQQQEPQIPPPSDWGVHIDHKRDRWEIGIPVTTMSRRQMEAYREAAENDPPPGWNGQEFGTYVVVERREGGRGGKRVLKVDLISGGGREEVSLSPLVFGNTVSDVRLKSSSLFKYRLGRLRTKAGTFRILALLTAIVSAVITAAFGIGKFTVWIQVSDDIAGWWLGFAAFLAALSAALTWFAGEWFKDDVA